jgi:formyl-CoA transferase
MLQEGALKGIRVLDMGRQLASPICTAFLGDFGADVIKLETPGKGDDSRNNVPAGGYFAAFNRSKRGITLDLKKGKDIFLRIVKEIDVLVENFRPGVLDKLGLGYDELKKVNPGLIYAEISGFGESGPYSMRAGLDPLIQGMTGIMSVTGFPGNRPVRCGASMCDVMAGTNAVIGILAALEARRLTGKGQKIDLALSDIGIVAMTSINQRYLSTGEIPEAMGSTFAAAAPGGSYQAKDGEVILQPTGKNGWKKFCSVIGREDLYDNPLYRTNPDRVAHRAELDKQIEEWTKDKTVDEIVASCRSWDLVAGPVLNVEQVVNDPHFSKARSMIVTVGLEGYDAFRIPGQAIKLSETPAVLTDAPGLGQHNKEIYGALGYSSEELEEMKKAEVI